MKKQLYKNETRLSVSALAVIAFGIWSVVKYAVNLILNLRGETNAYFGDPVITEAEQGAGFAIILILVVLSMLLEIGIRLYIGLAARAEGCGKKKRSAYLVFAVLLAILSGMSVGTLIMNSYSRDLFDTAVAVLVELSSLFALISLFVSGIKVKQLRKQTAEEGE